MAWSPRPLLLLFAPLLLGAQEAVVPGAAPTPTALELLPSPPPDARLLVPVRIGEGGPFGFIVDTGAERSVVSHELAEQLSLVPGRRITVVSTTERREVGTVVVPGIVTVPAIGAPIAVEAPAMAAAHLGAAGLLGLDVLRDRQIAIDFAARQIAVRRSAVRPVASAPGEIVVRGRSRFGQLIVTDAFYGNTRIRVVLDTGSEVTIGNLALRRKVLARREALRAVRLTSVTGGQLVADYAQVDKVRIGRIEIGTLPVAFVDAPPFEKFGLRDRPALLLGMDVLRGFRQVVIDFPNRELWFRLADVPAMGA